MTLYKAVRPDGTDFFAGTVRWIPEDGTLPHVVRHPSSKRAVRAHHSTSLAASTDCTQLPGSRWPMRLLVVEPVDEPVIETDTHKRQSVAWRVVEEVPAHLRFGPQGEHVAALIERARRLTPGDADALCVAEAAAWNADGAVSRDAAGDAAAAAAWDAAAAAAWDAAWDAKDAEGSEDAAWEAAGDAARVAARALVVRDLIGSHGFTQDHYDTLTQPWRTVIGPLHPDDAPMEARR